MWVYQMRASCAPCWQRGKVSTTGTGWSMGTGTMRLTLQRARPAAAPAADGATVPAATEREYGLSAMVAGLLAYFGVKIGAKSGSASAAAAHKARQEAETAVRSLLLHVTPDQVTPVMRTLGLPVTDNDTPSQAAA